MANESLYLKAKSLLKDDKFDQAIAIFEEIEEYEDSAEMITEAQYQKACSYQDKKNYAQAISIFQELSYYKNSSDKVSECIYAWIDYILDKGKASDADSFKNTVKLSSSYHATIYTKIINEINAHNDFDYWDDYWNNTDKATIIYNLLQTLPSSYQDNTNLSRLFNVLSNGNIHPVADYIRDNKVF
jgi:tetratricopeptide (TPR) repeat protein